MATKSTPRLPPLVPTGAARAWFVGGGGAGGGGEQGTGSGNEPDDPLSRGLRATLAAHDVPDEVLWAAWEVTTWAATAPLSERRALACLVVGALMAVESGGTYLALLGAGMEPQRANAKAKAKARTEARTEARTRSADEPLVAALQRLGVGEAERGAASSLAQRLSDGTAPPEIAALVGGPGARRPFVLAGGALYPERLWWLEERLAIRLRTRLGSTLAPLATEADARETVNLVGTSPGATPLSAQQSEAVRAALTGPLTVVAGGPGTGKTSTVVALLRTLVRLGVGPHEIALAAPTGRAAQRMKESVEGALARLQSPAPADLQLRAEFAGATTIHRLLGIRSSTLRPLDPEIPEFYGDWPLPHRIVIVDEASMIDLVLMERLCDAVAPHARLILIGDVDQLPSVDVGAVFRDLVAGVPDVTRSLTRSHRMNPADPAGAEILAVASAVNAGNPGAAMPPARVRAADLSFCGFERLGPGLLDEFLERWYAEALGAPLHFESALDRRFRVDQPSGLLTVGEDGRDGAGDVAGAGADALLVGSLLQRSLASRLLCLTRTAGRATSAAAINKLLHARVQGAALARGVDQETALAPFLPGEPVMVLRNDHARRLANGDLGVVLRIDAPRGEMLGVAFAQAAQRDQPDGRGAQGAPNAQGMSGPAPTLVVHPLEAIGAHLGLAFALTVHKAQGSEYERAALILPEGDVPLLTREILYTGLTRARRAMVVVGDLALFELAASRTLTRTSGLVEKLLAGTTPRA